MDLLKYIKEPFTKIQHFISDSINNMDHLRISGTKPSLVIISQTFYDDK